ncbi:MAG: DUF721 domain-containing protein [Phycisphaeraceae bacterium]|nr:DUF721 domain-containing protein [Phycisphaeraceae bacterium]
MKRTPVTMELERLRRFKAKVAPDLSMHEDIDEVYKSFAKQQKAVGALDDMWKQIAPPQFIARASVQKLSSTGVLTIKAEDAATAYEFDRWLRGGGLAFLKQRCRVTLKSVKVQQ